MILLADTVSMLMFAAGCAMLTLILLKRSYRYFGRRSKSSSKHLEQIHRPESKWDGAHRDTHAIIERQKVDLYEMSRDLNGQLNSRIIVLENLIAQSQRQIDRMEELLEEREHA